MGENLTSKKVKTRKDHICHGCSHNIKKGTKDVMLNVCVDDDDVIYNLYFCKECETYERKHCQRCLQCYEMEQSYEGYIMNCITETNKIEHLNKMIEYQIKDISLNPDKYIEKLKSYNMLSDDEIEEFKYDIHRLKDYTPFEIIIKKRIN